MPPRNLPQFDLDSYLPYRFAVIAQRLSTELAMSYRDKFDISIAEWRVLVNVGYAEGASIRDIEQRVSLEKSKVSRAASRLERRGFIEKEIADDDRRLVKLTLTQSGVSLLRDLIPLAQSYQDKLLAELGANHAALETALDLLERPKND